MAKFAAVPIRRPSGLPVAPTNLGNPGAVAGAGAGYQLHAQKGMAVHANTSPLAHAPVLGETTYMYVYMYIYIHTHIHVIYVYTYTNGMLWHMRLFVARPDVSVCV